MRYRYVEEDENFQNKVAEEGTFDGFDEILIAAKLFLEGDPQLERCPVVGSGAAHDLRRLTSGKDLAFPVVNFFFFVTSQSNLNDTVILHDFFVE